MFDYHDVPPSQRFWAAQLTGVAESRNVRTSGLSVVDIDVDVSKGTPPVSAGQRPIILAPLMSRLFGALDCGTGCAIGCVPGRAIPESMTVVEAVFGDPDRTSSVVLFGQAAQELCA